MPRKILDKKLLTHPEVKEILTKRSEIGELNYIQRITLDYVSRFSKLSLQNSQKLISILVNQFSINEETAYQIVNVMPKTPQELSVFLSGSNLSGDDFKKIIEVIKEFAESSDEDK
ncbi:MAG: hypothetical protein J7L07_01225 [Candidatus Odinarchaeota archaeon]|nr:hypothetical protein [Candidatus Odinarchaeota archaeon]